MRPLALFFIVYAVVTAISVLEAIFGKKKRELYNFERLLVVLPVLVLVSVLFTDFLNAHAKIVYTLSGILFYTFIMFPARDTVLIARLYFKGYTGLVKTKSKTSHNGRCFVLLETKRHGEMKLRIKEDDFNGLEEGDSIIVEDDGSVKHLMMEK